MDEPKSFPITPRPDVKPKGYTNSIKINFRGQVVSLRDLARVHGMQPDRLYNRIYEQDWSVEKAVSIPTTKLRG